MPAKKKTLKLTEKELAVAINLNTAHSNLQRELQSVANQLSVFYIMVNEKYGIDFTSGQYDIDTNTGEITKKGEE